MLFGSGDSYGGKLHAEGFLFPEKGDRLTKQIIDSSMQSCLVVGCWKHADEKNEEEKSGSLVHLSEI